MINSISMFTCHNYPLKTTGNKSLNEENKQNSLCFSMYDGMNQSDPSERYQSQGKI